MPYEDRVLASSASCYWRKLWCQNFLENTKTGITLTNKQKFGKCAPRQDWFEKISKSTWYKLSAALFDTRTWRETYFALKVSIIARAVWSMSFWASPKRLYDRFTAKDVICPWGSSSASSSILARTYPTIFPFKTIGSSAVMYTNGEVWARNYSH